MCGAPSSRGAKTACARIRHRARLYLGVYHYKSSYHGGRRRTLGGRVSCWFGSSTLIATGEGETMALELTHIWLLVDDMPRALGFYRDTLGLEVVSDLGAF